jgi:hypothetical protein
MNSPCFQRSLSADIQPYVGVHTLSARYIYAGVHTHSAGYSYAAHVLMAGNSLTCLHTYRHTRAHTHTHTCMQADIPVLAEGVSTFLDDARF